MKGLFAVILILAMALSLCACGETEPSMGDQMYEKYGALIDKLEAGDYDAAADSVFAMMPEGGEKYASVFGKMKEKDYDGIIAELQAMKPMPQNSQSHERKITADNWAEYFEVVEIPLTDESGKLQAVQFVFCLRDDVVDTVDCDRDFLIRFDYRLSCRSESHFEYDRAANTVTYTDEIRFDKAGYEKRAAMDISNRSLREEAEHDHSDPTVPCKCVISSIPVNEDTIQRYVFSLSGITGSIYLYD